MNPITKKIDAPCKQCGKSITHFVYFRIDGESHPALRKKVLDATAFVIKCPFCNRLSHVPQDFRYFDTIPSSEGLQYLIYYFPTNAGKQLEDTIAATITLRDQGTRVHMVHKLTDVAPLIQDYAAGRLPEETLVEVSDRAMQKAREQASAMDDAMDDAMGRMVEQMKSQSSGDERQERQIVEPAIKTEAIRAAEELVRDSLEVRDVGDVNGLPFESF